MANHKTYRPLDDNLVTMTTSKAFHYFRARRDKIRFVFDTLWFVDKIIVADRVILHQIWTEVQSMT